MLLRAPEVVALSVAGLVVAACTATGSTSPAGFLLLLATTLAVAACGARWPLVLTGDAVAFLVLDPHALRLGDLAFTGGLFVVAYLAGRAVWAGKHRVGALELEARAAAARQEELVAAAVAAERAAIAVELHDIVTHAVSAIVVQAQAGRRGDAQVAAGALSSIELSARSAMTELRRLLTLLGVEPGADSRSRYWPQQRDVALGASVAVLGEAELWSSERYGGHLVWPGPRWFSTVLVVALAGLLVMRRRRPEGVAAGVFGLLVVEGLLVGSAEAATLPVVLAVAAFSSAAHGARWRVLLPLVLAECSVFAVTDHLARGSFDRLWVFAVAALALGVGTASRRRQRTIVVLELEAAATAARHAQRVEQALKAERRALALELHDIVSHAVSVIVIQAQVGSRSPDSAAGALAAIEASSRTAMSELRRLLVLLSPADRASGVRPTPSLLQLEELLLRWRAAGLHVDLLTDDLPPLPPAVDLAAYRIVQESLTNTARHAPGARVELTLKLVDGHLEVSTRDSGHTTGATGQGTGRGLVGMRQRAELVGGTVLAAGRAGDGFVVRARLPLTGAPA
ncbi:MAG: sensor histidine kinase [Frankiales bacterium]|nr:sensor histidine kinase [Frankiales bacterium]